MSNHRRTPLQTSPVILALIAAIVLAILLYGYANDLIVTSINTSLTFLTVVLLWAYTTATQDMRAEMVRQFHFAQRPILNLYFRPGQDDGFFAVRNVSSVPAYNVEVEDIFLDGCLYSFHFHGQNNILEGGEERPFEMIVDQDGKLDKPPLRHFEDHFLPETLHQPEDIPKRARKFTVFVIQYHGLAGKEFYSVFKYYSRSPVTHEIQIEFITTGEGRMTMAQANHLAGRVPKKTTVYKTKQAVTSQPPPPGQANRV